MNDYLQLFLKKLTALEKEVVGSPDPAECVRKLKQYFMDDVHIQQMKCLQAFITYLWENSDIVNRDDFVNDLKMTVGHYTSDVNIAFIGGEKVKFEKVILNSIAFGQCSRQYRTEFFEKVKMYAESQGINFQDWFRLWKSNEGTM